MKKNYLSFFTILSVMVAGNLLAQDTYVTGPAKVKVNANTLFYNGGNFNIINESAGSPNTIINEGNIKIVGGFTNPASFANSTSTTYEKGNNFVNVWNGVDSYGQVIISNGATSTGLLTMEKNPINTSDFEFGQFAIPFQYGALTNADAFPFLFGEGISYVGDCPVNTNCANRPNQSMYSWDNVEYESDNEPASSTINSSKYYFLNFTSASNGLKALMDSHSNSNPLAYKGIPTPNEVSITMSHAGHPYFATSSWNLSGCATGTNNCWSRKINNYNEYFETYIDDAFIQLEDVGSHQTIYGKYGYQYGNPFTSNLDLSTLSLPNLRGVYKYSEVTATPENGGQNTTETQNLFVKATYSSGDWMGDPSALIVKPFEAFGIHLLDHNGGSITLGDSNKTFSMTPSGNMLPKAANSFYQLGLQLVENNETESLTPNHLYIVASESGITGEKQVYEADYTGIVTADNGFYGLQENIDGNISDFTPLYINAINAFDYIAKPINIVFNRSTSGSYKLKANLFEGSIFNKLAEGNFSDGSKFYFHDTEKNILREISSDFEYVIDDSVESSFDRFVIYWNGYPDGVMGTEDNLASSKTIVFKHGQQYKVRFNNTWNSADLAVYDITGRIVYTASNINTNDDHVLGVKQPGVYVVKAQNKKGEYELQKVIVK